jgi:hypothetical protein
MVRAFVAMPIGRVRWTAGPIAWLAQLPFLAQIPTWGATAMVATSIVAATPLVTGVAALNVAPVVGEAVDAPTPVDPGAEHVTPSLGGTPNLAVDPAADPNNPGGKPPDKQPPGRSVDTTTTTSTTTPGDSVTTTTKPGNGKGRDNGGGGGGGNPKGP